MFGAWHYLIRCRHRPTGLHSSRIDTKIFVEFKNAATTKFVMLMRSRPILNAEKDPAAHNLVLFGKKLMSLWPYRLSL